MGAINQDAITLRGGPSVATFIKGDIFTADSQIILYEVGQLKAEKIEEVILKIIKILQQ